MKTTSFAWQLLRDSARNFMADRALRLSAALAYYSIFALAPLLLITIAVASLIYGEQALRDELADQLRSSMGRPTAEAVQEIVKTAAQTAQGTKAAIIGVIMLLVGVTGFFGELKGALNSVWQVEAKPGCSWQALARDRLFSFGMVLIIGLLLLFSLAASAVMAGVSAYTERFFNMPDVVWTSLNFIVSMLLSTVLFAAVFKVLPDVKVPWRTVGAGAVLTAVLFEIGKIALAFYLGRESMTSGFGAAGSIILILVWVYYASAILLFGAEVTQVWAQRRGVPIRLGRFAIRLRPVEDRYTISESSPR